MLKIQLTIVSAFLFFSISAQHFECGFDAAYPNPEIKKASTKKINDDEYCDNNVVRVHFYLLRDNNGENGVYQEKFDEGLVTSEEDFVQQHIDILNDGFAFSQYSDKLEREAHSNMVYAEDIQFVSEGWDYLDNTMILNGDEIFQDLRVAAAASYTAVNVYLGLAAPTASSSARFPWDLFNVSALSLKKIHVLRPILTHEMGHALGLYHTFHGVSSFHPSSGLYAGSEDDSGIYTLNDEFPFGENCDTRGDRICDTYPIPSTGYGPDGCLDIDDGNNYHWLMPIEPEVDLDLDNLDQYETFPFARTDEFGVPYQFHQFDNFMKQNQCMTRFSPGQSQAMANSLHGLYSSLNLATSDDDFFGSHEVVVTGPSECDGTDGIIEVTVPEGGMVWYLDYQDNIISSSDNDVLIVNIAGAYPHRFAIQGSDPCQLYIFFVDVPLEDCPADINGDGSITAGDLTSFLGAFGTTCCTADINGDFYVDTQDQVLLVGAINTNLCDGVIDCIYDINNDGDLNNNDFSDYLIEFGRSCRCCVGDLNHDGMVTASDLTMFLGQFGQNCDGSDLAINRSIQSRLSDEDLTTIFNTLYEKEVDPAQIKEIEQYIFNNKSFSKDEISIHIYPSPASDMITIVGDFENLNLEILDMDGRIVSQLSNTFSPIRWDVSNLANGIYIVRDSKNFAIQKRLVISK